MDTPRLAPITNPSAEVIELFDRAGLRAADGSPLNIFGTLAHHPALMRRWLVFATHVLAKNSLPPRDRELLILRAGWRCHSQYEFSQHALIALRSDIDADEVRRTKLAVDDGGWSDHDAALLRAADELHDDACIGEATWNTLASRLTEQQMLDVIFTVGTITWCRSPSTAAASNWTRAWHRRCSGDAVGQPPGNGQYPPTLARPRLQLSRCQVCSSARTDDWSCVDRSRPYPCSS